MNRALWLLTLCCGPPLAAQQPVTLQGGQSVTVKAAPRPPAVRDTVWCTAGVCRPVPPTAHDTTPSPVAKGIGIGPFNGTPGTGATLYINANSPSNLKTQLAAAEIGGYCIFAAPTGGGHSQYITGDHWDYAKWKVKINAYKKDSLVWRSYAAKGVLCGWSPIDEPQASSTWGGKPVPWNTVGQAACYMKAIVPNLSVYTRSNPRQIASGTTCLDGGLSQFDASIGSVTVFANAEIVAAKAKGLLMTGGFNGDNGGKIVSGCLKSTTRVGECQVSAAEVTANFAALLKDSTVVCGGTMWFPNAATYATWAARSDVKAALAKVIAWGKTRPRPKRCG